MADILVAHLDSDEDLATRLADVLRRNSWSVALLALTNADETGAPDPEPAADAACLIAVWSQDSLASASLLETATAAAERDCLVSVLRGCAQAPGIAGRSPVLDLTDWHADISIAGAFDGVISAVQRVRGETIQMSRSGGAEPTAPLKTAEATEQLAGVKAEEAHWDSISESQDVWDYEAFLEKYPDGYFADAARASIKKLRIGAAGGNTGVILIGIGVAVLAVAIGLAGYAIMTWSPGDKPAVVAVREPAKELPDPFTRRPGRKPPPPKELQRPPTEGSGPSSAPERSGGPAPYRRPSGGAKEPRTSASHARECDRLTASGFDGKRKASSVPLSRIRSTDAISACRNAVRRNPDKPRLQFQLGRAFYANKQYDDALPLFRRAAEREYPVAMYRLGKMHQRGIGLTKDYRLSVSWFRRGAEAGNAAAMNDLGWMYERGRGVAKDDREAARWYRKAAEKGHIKAMYYLGRRYASGRGVDKDDAESMRWYRRAANKGYADAFYSVGWMYEKGRSVGQDHAEAVRWYRKAAAKGASSAMNAMGRHYLNGEGVAKDAAEALKWFRKGASKGLLVSINNVGLAYDKGRGIAKDKTEAVKWYRRAAKAGYAPGMHNLAAMYDDGTGVNKDPTQAAHWIFEALKKGNNFTIKQMKTKSNIWSKPFRRDLQRRLRDAGVYDGRIGDVFSDAVKTAIDKLVQQKS